MREKPLLADMADAYSGDDVVVLGLNEDLPPDDALAFLDEIGGVGYLLAAGLDRLRDSYGYRGLPYRVVIGQDGMVI
ncbi:MAG: hypothetical protein HN899_12730 [Gemmatimonadales bacterium]|nr:hypothetical protein [Gemmatimonadales bacterium]MBT7126019.1 hypothetical protein [Gemmatimonadales bacterium]